MPDTGNTLFIVLVASFSAFVLLCIAQDIWRLMHPQRPQYEPSIGTRTGSIRFYHEGDAESQFSLDEISIPELSLEGHHDAEHMSHNTSGQTPEPSRASSDIYPAPLPVLSLPKPTAGHMFRERSASVGSSTRTAQIQEGRPVIRPVSWPRAAQA
ncbi:hypothetical protein PENSPDRAFT_688962 [Peniophora sp. CONT]|nr:hypothetical protein PENSPDRAFT_688962 [Peniophora sp. CONT]